jgi:hypothetical protein
MFWARDEYIGGGNFNQRRGYYNAQNLNAIDLNVPGFVQADSIMSSGGALDRAFQNVTTSDVTLAQLGWVDSDGDGVFDVLDVPLKLEGLGQLNADRTQYVFKGRATVQTLPNQNSSGLQNDITINQVGRIEYRWNDGNWITLSTPNTGAIDLNFSIPVPAGTTGEIQIRAAEAALPLTSNIFRGSLDLSRDTAALPGIQGFVWNDQNKDDQWQASESGITNARIRLVDGNRQLLALQRTIEPDSLPVGTVVGNQNGITVEAIGEDASGPVAVFEDALATTGTRVFRPFVTSLNSYQDSFRGNQQQLRATLVQATSYASIDVVAVNNGTVARLDAYSSAGKLLKRFETPSLSAGQSTTMSVGTDGNEIAYVIARGTRNALVKFDRLRVGPASETTTGLDGSYYFAGVQPGTYQVEIIPPNPQYDLVQPATGLQTTSLVASGIVSKLDFAIASSASPWQNQNIANDANNDGLITALDVLVIINEINRNGARELTGTTIVSPPFYDVNGDRSITALDVLVVINYINSHQGSGEGEALPYVDLDQESLSLGRKSNRSTSRTF